jgi:hypothetical protein
MPQPKAVDYAEPIALDVAALQCLIDFLDDPNDPCWGPQKLLEPRAPEDSWAACPPGPDMRDLFVLPRDWNLAPDYSDRRFTDEGMLRRARELAALLDFRTERAVEWCQAPLYWTSAPHVGTPSYGCCGPLHDKQLKEEFAQALTHAQARTRTKLALLRKRDSSGWTPDASIPLVPGRVCPFSSARWPDQRLHAHLDSGMQDVELPPDPQEMPASKKDKHYKGSVNLQHVMGNMKLKA